MEIVGKKFEREEYLIPDMLASAECVGVAMDIMSPHLLKAGVESKGQIRHGHRGRRPSRHRQEHRIDHDQRSGL